MKGNRLSYFSSVEVPKELEDIFRSLEDILQVQHGTDGRHPLATPAQDGFLTADDKRKIDKLWEASPQELGFEGTPTVVTPPSSPSTLVVKYSDGSIAIPGVDEIQVDIDSDLTLSIVGTTIARLSHETDLRMTELVWLGW